MCPYMPAYLAVPLTLLSAFLCYCHWVYGRFVHSLFSLRLFLFCCLQVLCLVQGCSSFCFKLILLVGLVAYGSRFVLFHPQLVAPSTFPFSTLRSGSSCSVLWFAWKVRIILRSWFSPFFYSPIISTRRGFVFLFGHGLLVDWRCRLWFHASLCDRSAFAWRHFNDI